MVVNNAYPEKDCYTGYEETKTKNDKPAWVKKAHFRNKELNFWYGYRNIYLKIHPNDFKLIDSLYQDPNPARGINGNKTESCGSLRPSCRALFSKIIVAAKIPYSLVGDSPHISLKEMGTTLNLDFKFIKEDPKNKNRVGRDQVYETIVLNIHFEIDKKQTPKLKPSDLDNTFLLQTRFDFMQYLQHIQNGVVASKLNSISKVDRFGRTVDVGLDTTLGNYPEEPPVVMPPEQQQDDSIILSLYDYLEQFPDVMPPEEAPNSPMLSFSNNVMPLPDVMPPEKQEADSTANLLDKKPEVNGDVSQSSAQKVQQGL